jgi:hypothetical protein
MGAKVYSGKVDVLNSPPESVTALLTALVEVSVSVLNRERVLVRQNRAARWCLSGWRIHHERRRHRGTSRTLTQDRFLSPTILGSTHPNCMLR